MAHNPAKFRPLPPPSEGVSLLVEECVRCRQPIAPGERHYLSWEMWPSGRVARMQHLACAAKERTP